jgi:hypothetical protein
MMHPVPPHDPIAATLLFLNRMRSACTEFGAFPADTPHDTRLGVGGYTGVKGVWQETAAPRTAQGHRPSLMAFVNKSGFKTHLYSHSSQLSPPSQTHFHIPLNPTRDPSRTVGFWARPSPYGTYTRPAP